MRRTVYSIFLIIAFVNSFAQSNLVTEIKRVCPPSEALSTLSFLASDELKGRSAIRPEIDIAARYISEAFRSFNLKQIKGTTDYFQTFSLTTIRRANLGNFTVANTAFEMVKSLQVGRGRDTVLKAPVVYANHGFEPDLENLDVKGKIVITEYGERGRTPIRQAMGMLMNEKAMLLEQKGAVAVIERFKSVDATWAELENEYTQSLVLPIDPPRSKGIPVLLINDTMEILPKLPMDVQGTLTIQGFSKQNKVEKNVMGCVEGKDPELKSEYIVLSSHYDHLGVSNLPEMEEGKLDSIYNGARDNAIGTAAVISAARYFAAHPPKRSVLFIAFTAEEVGELGSKYFANHAPVPLKDLVFDLNADNMSYNDTSIITIVGMGRTNVDEEIRKACKSFGLKIIADPAPEQHSFERSDNFSFSVNGVPSVSFELGMTAYDSTIRNRYHRLSDEVGNLNLSYAIKYIYSYILSAKNIADLPVQPKWRKGDIYEEAWMKLYQ